MRQLAAEHLNTAWRIRDLRKHSAGTNSTTFLLIQCTSIVERGLTADCPEAEKLPKEDSPVLYLHGTEDRHAAWELGRRPPTPPVI